VLQKETDHYFSALTKVDCNATDTSVKAGLYLTNGNQKTFVRLYAGYDAGKKIEFSFDTAIRRTVNNIGNTVWLKITRYQHKLSGFCSADGKQWISIGAPIDVANLDKVQPNYNSWVGTSIGLFAEGKPADFDQFVCKDGFSVMPAVGYSNFYGVEKIKTRENISITNNSDYGGWIMISGVDFGIKPTHAAMAEISAASLKGGNMEIWLDDIGRGTMIATVAVKPTNGESNFKKVRSAIGQVSGQHDVFIKFPAGSKRDIFVESLQFVR
jgi:hypothetical protein